MEVIAKHPYYKVQREVNVIEQKNVEYERMLVLYEDKLVTQHREFSAEHIFDMSYRELSGGEGMLYVHTSKGVFSYNVKSDPSEFIQAFKQLEKRILERKKRENR
ncbi:hypothetical protein [Salisediminibacterium halotolerans]|uniref:PH domain-containing protein n=1 Tax=Salisediminibacterium halotolerans TaxID=517425 RepID=A0A1H9TIU8_9BACI|nr:MULTISPECIES: hypothetical protein [Salisediminibacterium]RLJ72363.1 hypothetical protein BCL39_2263 [Actinophytocola xinjiangensis]RPE85577.1 hypothetical protein EDD67_2398 [Salisediminibacterium halotolerans]TWG33532.1 hypothetical protein BCL52_2258 [Salisediminibacterium halotolerans]SER97270.1 hypothetical protein SAMN05444126_11048 [Salisediminibacterium haloalkalitolerans]GEL08839.1 hypothetical protein SHA02_22550 [Salisediminibacterium halotolerans]